MKEEWCVIEEAPRYSISNYGRVENNKTGRIIRPGTNSEGYQTVILATDEASISTKTHRLVAKAFCDGYSPGMEVNHIDGDKFNNCSWNLEWVTRSQNQRHAFRTGLQNRRGGLIRIIETGEIFETQKEVADAINGSQSAIALCLLGRRRHHKNYTFEYVEEQYGFISSSKSRGR